ncbi:hypothetical protein [uncultured Microbulbifer sp.]|uniref:hypothetical protein n=1 Tax=uncultured Microbulbifer sp. TaxID=348147 RepID=UPI00263628AD|nr:hypothetical protein [uncultured Microbulbifer sp.]
MDISQAFKSSFAKAADFPVPVRVSVLQVEMEPVGRDQQLKPVGTFRRLDTGESIRVTINQTNGQRLAGAFGHDTDHWVNRQVEISARPTTYRGQPVQGIHMEPVVATPNTEYQTNPPAQQAQPPMQSQRPQQPAPQQAPQQPGQLSQTNPNDDIPF